MHLITLPDQVFEFSLFELVTLLGEANSSEQILVDFIHVNYYVPGGIVVLITKFHRWLDEGKKVSIENHEQCRAYKYLQRIDFFKLCGLELNENFHRHPSVGRFVPVSKITYDTESLATEIATCLEPVLAESDDIEKTGPFDYFEYSISELGNNTMQHSRGKGFASAQYTKSSDYIRVAIADTGIGIKRSFEENMSPHYSQSINDVEAIELALKPKVSSKDHISAWGESPNMGVGLTLLRKTVCKLDGKFIIISGNGFLSTDKKATIKTDCIFKGTLCTFMFKRNTLSNFYSLLNAAKIDLGLIKDQNKFGELFL